MYRVSILVLSLALASGACGKKSSTTPTAPEPVAKTEPTTPTEPAKPGTPSDAELNAMFEQTLAFLSDMAAAVGDNEADCKKMATAIDATMTKHQDLLAKAKSFEGNEAVDKKADEFMKAHEEEMTAAQGKMGAGLQACMNDPDVQKAMSRFDEM
jgi:hypothetical protein